MVVTAKRTRIRELEELTRELDALTAALNGIRTNREARVYGLVKWALPKVAEERVRASDLLAELRAGLAYERGVGQLRVW